MANWFNSVGNWFSGYIKQYRHSKKNIVINQVNVSPVVRKSLEIGEFKDALVAAEGWGQQRRSLLEIYENVKLDEQVTECMERRLRQVTKDLTLMDEGEEIEEVEMLTRKSFFRKAIREVLNARFHGHTLLELDWNTNYEGVTDLIDRRHVKPRFGAVVAQPFDMEGIAYRENPFNKNLLEAGEDEDLGRLLQCCIPAILRRGNYSDMAEFAATLGIPIKIGKYSNDEAREILEAAFENLGPAGFIVMPNDAEVDIQNPPNIGQNADIFEALHKMCTNSISIALLGNSMTTNEATTGGYAQGKVQQDGELDVFEDDRAYMLAWLNEKLTPYLRQIGFAIPETAEWIYETEERMTKKDKLAVLETLARNGIPVGMTTWYETAGVPEPSENDLPPALDDDEEEESDKTKKGTTK